jgi:septum formation protein
VLVLASRSPRRAELLKNAGLPFIVRSAEIDETPLPQENPEEYVKRLAQQKALAVECGRDEIVLAADTTVIAAGQMLGKPVDRADAVRMLEALSGRKHTVITGICLRWSGELISDWATTQVWFAALTPGEIQEYVASGEPMDKAGAYGIQGIASRFIDRIDGCYNNVVGLPVAVVYRHLSALRRF